MTEASAKSTAAAVDDKPGKSTKAPKSPSDRASQSTEEHAEGQCRGG